MKYSVEIHGRETSLSLEPEFIAALKRRARERNMSIYKLVEEMSDARKRKNLSSEIRVCILQWEKR